MTNIPTLIGVLIFGLILVFLGEFSDDIDLFQSIVAENTKAREDERLGLIIVGVIAVLVGVWVATFASLQYL
jgi:hypothetical protein